MSTVVPGSQPHRLARRRRRRAATLAGLTVGVLAASSLAITVSAASAAETTRVSAVLGQSPVYTGVTAATPGDEHATPLVKTIDGRECWSMSDDPYVRYVYVDVDSAAVPADSSRAIVTLDFYDAAAIGMNIQFDGASGGFTSAGPKQTAGTRSWSQLHWELGGARWTNRTNGSDLRLDVWGNKGEMPDDICISGISVTFTDKPLAAATSLAVLSPSLIYPEGDGSISLASPADTIAYVIGDPEGVPLHSGTLATTSGAASLDVSELDEGYYTLDVSADPGVPVTRSTSFAVLSPAPTEGNEFYGVNMHNGWQSPQVTDALLDDIALIGWGGVRIGSYWDYVEKTPGVYEQEDTTFARDGQRLHDLGISTWTTINDFNEHYDGRRTVSTPEGIAALGAYAAETLRFSMAKGYSDELGLTNEYDSTGFNNGACGLTADCFAQLLTATRSAVDEKAPGGRIVAPTTAGVHVAFAQRLIDLGVLQDIDVYSVNYYGQNFAAPEQSPVVDQLPELVELLAANDGGRELPVRVSENGYPTHGAGVTESDQADYTVRAQVLAEAAGATDYYAYDVMDDGFDGTEKEHRFGLVRRPDDTVCWQWMCPSGETYGAIHGISPKPAAVAQAILIRQTAGLAQGARLALGSDSLWAYPYTGPQQSVTVLWSTGSEGAQVTAAAPFETVDQFGARTRHPAGSVTFAVTGSPIYVRGDVTVAAAAPIATISAPEQWVTGSDLPVTITAADGAGLEVTVDGVTAALASGDTAVTIPATSRVGVREITAQISSGGRVVGTVHTQVRLVAPFDAWVEPIVTSGPDGLEQALAVFVRNNNAAGALPVTGIAWRTGTQSGTIASPAAVPAGETGRTVVPIADSPWFTASSATVTVIASGETKQVVRPVSFSPIEADGAESLPAISLDQLGAFIGIGGGTRQNAADLGGTLQVTHTETGLRVRATITDDVHQGDREPGASWQVDSIQFNTYDLFPTQYGGQRVEIAAALLDSGPVVYTFAPPAGQSAGVTPNATADIVRDDTAGTTAYDVTVGWAELGYAAPPEGVFGFSFLVNDADRDRTSTDARSGYLEWGSGVGGSPKDPTKFRSVQLVSAPPAPDTVKPETTLVSPTTAGPVRDITIQVDATDDRGLKRIVANVYRDGTLVKSTQTAADGALTATHTATVTLPDGTYVIRYNAEDLAGNIATTKTFTVVVDRTPPKVTVKDGAQFTVQRPDGYQQVSFKLHDAGRIDRLTLNGVTKDLTDDVWSDLNFVKPGSFGAVSGLNTLVVFDVAGNTTTVTFTLL